MSEAIDYSDLTEQIVNEDPGEVMSAAEGMGDLLGYAPLDDAQASELLTALFTAAEKASGDSELLESIFNSMNQGLERFGPESMEVDWTEFLSKVDREETTVLYQLIPALQGYEGEAIQVFLEEMRNHSNGEIKELVSDYFG